MDGRFSVLYLQQEKSMVTTNTEKYTSEQLLAILSEDYNCVYLVNIDENSFEPYLLSDPIKKNFGDYFKTNPTYDDAIRKYILNTVVKRQQHEMLQEASRENLKHQLSAKNIFVKDFKVERDGSTCFFRMKAVRLTATDGQLTVVLGFADISFQKQKELEQYAYTDSVTDGHNYNYFKESVSLNKMPGYILAMDIHSFKVVNKVCGIKTGDITIKGIYRTVLKQLREQDVIGHVNADQFAIFLSTDDQKYVTQFINSVTIDLLTFSIRMKVPQLIPYFGITKWTSEKKIEMLYSEAKTAKLESKNNPSSNYAYYSEADATKMLEIKKIEDEFEEALKQQSFEIWYQKKCNPLTGKMVGAEALVRWKKSDGEFLPPADFIPIYEHNGMIRKLDEYIFRQVCKQQKEWLMQGYQIVPISINVSRASLYYLDIVDIYRNIADEFDLTPSFLPIEITESATIDNNEVKDIVNNFRLAGFPLHMDDFGSGYSSLATLNVIHFDTLKLDKTLVDYIGNYGGERLLEHTISLSKELGMQVTAEGVEKEEQVQFLTKLSCDSIQGFYFARPQPAEEFVQNLEIG